MAIQKGKAEERKAVLFINIPPNRGSSVRKTKKSHSPSVYTHIHGTLPYIELVRSTTYLIHPVN